MNDECLYEFNLINWINSGYVWQKNREMITFIELAVINCYLTGERRWDLETELSRAKWESNKNLVSK